MNQRVLNFITVAESLCALDISSAVSSDPGLPCMKKMTSLWKQKTLHRHETFHINLLR